MRHARALPKPTQTRRRRTPSRRAPARRLGARATRHRARTTRPPSRPRAPTSSSPPPSPSPSPKRARPPPIRAPCGRRHSGLAAVGAPADPRRLLRAQAAKRARPDAASVHHHPHAKGRQGLASLLRPWNPCALHSPCRAARAMPPPCEPRTAGSEPTLPHSSMRAAAVQPPTIHLPLPYQQHVSIQAANSE